MKTPPAMLGTGKWYWALFLIPHLSIWSIYGKAPPWIISCLISQGCCRECVLADLGVIWVYVVGTVDETSI